MEVKMSKKHRHLGFPEYYEAVVYAVLNNIKNYDVKPKNGKKEFYITKLKTKCA